MAGADGDPDLDPGLLEASPLAGEDLRRLRLVTGAGSVIPAFTMSTGSACDHDGGIGVRRDMLRHAALEETRHSTEAP